MGNKIYRKRYIREVFLKDGTILKYTGQFGDFQYGVPTNETLKSEEWSEMLKQLDYVPEYQGEIDRKKEYGYW